MKRKYTTLRCPRCHVAKSHCVCAIEPKIQSKHRFKILIHPEEFKKPTNTSFLAANVLEPFEMVSWSRVEPDRRFLESIESAKNTNIVAFPSSNALPMEKYLDDFPLGPKTVIFLDGTWKQARKIYNLSPYLHGLPAVVFKPQEKTEYQLRRQKKEFGLSTIESMVEALRILKEEAEAKKLRAYFRVFQYAYIQAKLNLPNNMDLTTMYQDMLDSEGPKWDFLSMSKSI